MAYVTGYCPTQVSDAGEDGVCDRLLSHTGEWYR